MSVQDTRTDSKSDDDARLVAALDEFQLVSKNEAKFDQGEFLSRYPDLADRLKDCLSALVFVESAIPSPLQRPTASRLLSAGSVIGDFRIVREIGRGKARRVAHREDQDSRRDR